VGEREAFSKAASAPSFPPLHAIGLCPVRPVVIVVVEPQSQRATRIRRGREHLDL
jgi:hypothetical protein